MMLKKKIILPAPVINSHTLLSISLKSYPKSGILYEGKSITRNDFVLFLITVLSKSAEKSAAKKPRKYIPISTNAL